MLLRANNVPSHSVRFRQRGSAIDTRISKCSVAVEASGLTGAVWVTGARVVGVVGPLALNLPLAPVAEWDQRDIEGPGALVSVLLTASVVPGAGAVGIGTSFGEFVPADIGQRCQALRVQAGSILRIAARVAIKIEEEGNLHGHAAARTEGVISTVTSVAPLQIDIDRVITVGDGACNFLAHFGHDRGSGTAISCRRGIDEMTVMSHGWSHLTIGSCVFIGCLGVIGVIETCVPGIEAGDFVTSKR